MSISPKSHSNALIKVRLQATIYGHMAVSSTYKRRYGGLAKSTHLTKHMSYRSPPRTHLNTLQISPTKPQFGVRIQPTDSTFY